jgi:hypothetical protein
MKHIKKALEDFLGAVKVQARQTDGVWTRLSKEDFQSFAQVKDVVAKIEHRIELATSGIQLAEMFAYVPWLAGVSFGMFASSADSDDGQRPWICVSDVAVSVQAGMASHDSTDPNETIRSWLDEVIDLWPMYEVLSGNSVIVQIYLDRKAIADLLERSQIDGYEVIKRLFPSIAARESASTTLTA